ncbi:hypothetical protein EIP91_010582 [Steccherinum ochraceum]|uniref:Uncharacterized protein n=1 Tax=Steccherinum ochraceum TaxID=92696 RepID=A0A4R0RLS7_9APHY|nr:hypothetical protein EIP91_010582 [Steccherinum ochraceum]
MRVIAALAAFIVVAFTAALAAPLRLPVPSVYTRGDFSDLTVRDTIKTLNGLEKRAGGETSEAASASWKSGDPDEQAKAAAKRARQAANVRNYRKNNPEQSAQTQRKWRINNPEQYDESQRKWLDKPGSKEKKLEAQRKRRAKKAGTPQEPEQHTPTPGASPAPLPPAPAPASRAAASPPPRPLTPVDVAVHRGTANPGLIGPRR